MFEIEPQGEAGQVRVNASKERFALSELEERIHFFRGGQRDIADEGRPGVILIPPFGDGETAEILMEEFGLHKREDAMHDLRRQLGERHGCLVVETRKMAQGPPKWSKRNGGFEDHRWVAWV